MSLGEQKPRHNMQEITSVLDDILKEHQNLEQGHFLEPDVNKIVSVYDFLRSESLESKNSMTAAEKLQSVLRQSANSAGCIYIGMYQRFERMVASDEFCNMELLHAYKQIIWHREEFLNLIDMEKEFSGIIESYKNSTVSENKD